MILVSTDLDDSEFSEFKIFEEIDDAIIYLQEKKKKEREEELSGLIREKMQDALEGYRQAEKMSVHLSQRQRTLIYCIDQYLRGKMYRASDDSELHVTLHELCACSVESAYHQVLSPLMGCDVFDWTEVLHYLIDIKKILIVDRDHPDQDPDNPVFRADTNQFK